MTQPPTVSRAGGAVARRSRLGRFLGATLFAVVVYGGFAVWRGVDKIGSELARYTWWTFAAGCALALGCYLIRWLKWQFYLNRLGLTAIPRTDSFLTYLSGFVLTVTPGKVGEVFKSVILFETYGVPFAKTAPIVVAERLTDVIGVVVLVVYGSAGLKGGLVWAGIGTALVLGLVGVIASRPLSHAIIALVERGPGPLKRVGPRLHEAYDSLATLLRPSNLLVPAVISVAAWSLECTALWIILRGFGEKVPIGLATFFYATSTLAGAIVPTPGGVGVTETSLQEQMQGLGHVSPAASTCAMILVRFATLWFAVLVGFAALTVLKRRHPRLLAAETPAQAPATAE